MSGNPTTVRRRRRSSLHQSKILVERSGFFGRRHFKLVLEDDGREVPILRASNDKANFLFRKNCYEIFGQRGIDFHKTGDPGANDEKNWNVVGQISSPGWFYDRSVVYNSEGNGKAITMYSCTSRTGDLMKMKVALPKVHKEEKLSMTEIIHESSSLPRDCSSVIATFIGPLYWSEEFHDVTPQNCAKYIDNKLKTNTVHDEYVTLENKVPMWNPGISAYTLEFCGRALLPSVHNFQLENESGEVVLQLGKVDNDEFNMDFTYPLSAFQAFTICLSVIQRTFVWD